MRSVAELWDEAQHLEARSRRDEARTAYEMILAREPHHVAALLRVSRLEQLADRYALAKEHVQRAALAVREHSNTRNMGYVTARLLEFAEEREVASLLLSADWSDPHVIRQAAVLAQHLWLSGHYQDALRFLDSISQHSPAHPLLTYTRANVLRYLGDTQGAERGYEACLALSPDLADAHWALATHSRANPPLTRVPRIRASLTRVPADGIEQAHLFYALFRELDAADGVDAAWPALLRGADIMRRKLAYDSQLEALRLEQLIRMPAPAPEPATAEPLTPIFIVGMPRTGTTLLDRMLGNHAAVQSLGERNDFSAAVSEACGRFFRSALHAELQTTLQSLDFDRVGQLYLRRLRTLAPWARYVVDKNPQNLFNLPILLRAVPGARVLCLRRDPMDACFSNLKELFQGGAYAYSYSLEHLADHYLRAQRWIEHWLHVAPRSVHCVVYEDLVNHPERTLAAVVDFIGLEAQLDLHEITRNTAPVSTASSSQVRERLHGRGIGAWKRYESQLQPLRARLGV